MKKSHFLKRFQSTTNITIFLTIVVTLSATAYSGAYILVNTIVTAGMLAMVAMGLALVFGVMNIPMFAHGEYFMIGSLTAYFVIAPINEFILTHADSQLALWGPLIAMAAAALMGAVIGLLSEKLIFSELRKRNRDNWVMNSFLLTVGISVVLINAHQLFFNPNFKGVTNYWGGPPLELFGAFISMDRVLAFSLSIVMVISFWLFMGFTRTGRAIRAVSQDEVGASMVGINLNVIFLLTMALSCSLASLAGASLLFMYPSFPSVGLEPLYMAWFVVILAGLGNVLGAVVGAFIVALLKSLTVEYIGSGWEFVIPSALIIVILIFKPSGLFSSGVRSVLDS